VAFYQLCMKSRHIRRGISWKDG